MPSSSLLHVPTITQVPAPPHVPEQVASPMPPQGSPVALHMPEIAGHAAGHVMLMLLLHLCGRHTVSLGSQVPSVPQVPVPIPVQQSYGVSSAVQSALLKQSESLSHS